MRRHATTTADESLESQLDAGDGVGTAVLPANRGASEMISATGDFVSRLVYTTSYAVSYGVVFPTMLVVRAVPKDNALVHGLTDGALAARDRVFGWHEAGWDDGDEEMDETEAEGTDGHDESAGTGGRRRRTTHRARGGRKASH